MSNHNHSLLTAKTKRALPPNSDRHNCQPTGATIGVGRCRYLTWTCRGTKPITVAMAQQILKPWPWAAGYSIRRSLCRLAVEVGKPNRTLFACVYTHTLIRSGLKDPPDNPCPPTQNASPDISRFVRNSWLNSWASWRALCNAS